MIKSIARRPNSQSLLTQLISNNALVKDVQNLDSVIVKKIIHHIGLEDSGELLMLLTSEQMQEVMDQDTWMSSRPGEDEHLDAKRFCTWLEVLLEVGSDFAAEKVAEMDEDLLTAVLAQLVMAMDSDELDLMTRSAEDDGYSENKYLEKALESTFNMEIEGYLVMSKATFQWDAISNLLMSLQKDHRDLIDRILSRIQRVTLDQIEEFDGLYNLLKEGDMLEGDVSYEREQRREKEGFVAPSSAAAFLKLIAQTSLEDLLKSEEQDHISKMYFRNYKPSKVRQPSSISPELLKILNVHGVNVTTSKAKLLGTGKAPSAMKKYFMELNAQDEIIFQQKLSELNFLANILVSGYSGNKKRLRPVEAMDMVFHVCDEGLQYAIQHNIKIDSSEILKLFKVGWKLKQGPT